jgi:GH43 family beta-xylosidase
VIHRDDLTVRDPFILLDNDIYYLYGTFSDSGFIGYTSKDLIYFDNKTVIFEKYDGFWAENSFWAPEVHKYNGKYYLFGTMYSKERGRATQIFVSDKPLGKYVPLSKEGITPKKWFSLDGTLYVDKKTPYIFFCHEWLQVTNGEIYIQELKKDLSDTIGEPKLLFTAKDASWVVPVKEGGFITDGPFVYFENKQYHMLWSSFSKNGYALAHATAFNIFGPWKQDDQLIYDNDGGHGMIFIDKEGQRRIAIHSPNSSGKERLKII